MLWSLTMSLEIGCWGKESSDKFVFFSQEEILMAPSLQESHVLWRKPTSFSDSVKMANFSSKQIKEVLAISKKTLKAFSTSRKVR